MTAGALTPTQARILALLSDGLPHTRREIHALLWDREASELASIQPHISRIRRHVRPRGEEVVCEVVRRRLCYRHVRLLGAGGG